MRRVCHTVSLGQKLNVASTCARVFIFPSAEAEAAEVSVIRCAAERAQGKHSISLQITPTRHGACA